MRLWSATLALAVLACGGGGVTGTWKATQPDGTITLELKTGGKAQMIMTASGQAPDTANADYLVNGNEVTVQVPMGMPLVLIRDGNVLQANMMGQVMRFEKQ